MGWHEPLLEATPRLHPSLRSPMTPADPTSADLTSADWPPRPGSADLTSADLAAGPAAPTGLPAADLETLHRISERVLWLSAAIVDAANRGRPNDTGVKVGGHQASSASMVDIMVALWFHELTSARPGLGQAARLARCCTRSTTCSATSTRRTCPRCGPRAACSPTPAGSRTPTPSTSPPGRSASARRRRCGRRSSHRYVRSQFPDAPPAGRFVSLLGDAELDEGAIWEAVADPRSRQPRASCSGWST